MGWDLDQRHHAFVRYIGIDYSGVRTPTASLSGLRVYLDEGDAPLDGDYCECSPYRRLQNPKRFQRYRATPVPLAYPSELPKVRIPRAE